MKILIVGKTSSLSREFSQYLNKKKNSTYKVVRFKEFLKYSLERIKKFDFIINFCIHKNYLKNKYKKKYDLDLKILKKISNLNNTKFVMISSSKVYFPGFNLKETSKTKPKNNYGKNKLITENEISKKFKNHLILRLSNIICKNKKKINSSFVTKTFFDIVRSNLVKKKIIFPKGNIYKDFIFGEDFSKLLYSSLEKNLMGIYNLSSGKKLYLKDLALNLSKITGYKILYIKKETDSFVMSNLKLIKKLNFNKSIKIVNLNNLKKII